MRAVLLASVVPLLVACAAEETVAPAPAIVASIIVKPRVPATGEEVLTIARAQLGRDAGVRYARPMAGDAHILYLTAPASRAQVSALIERLQAAEAFQYVELDSMMKIQ